ncbi:membrane protein insertion efficiency factor YidD [uncultured Methylobacterium sp.]|uniref:membrane protein insertion efficiency factor YidD n=1 Tax=uncultured Methylobacterium sp. TaxID=157278 RepID=UPI0035CC5DC1
MLRQAAHVAIRGYQLTLSGLTGRQCRHWPSCSEYADQAIARHGPWPGAWMGFSRICRCGPFGTHGIDLVPESVPPRSAWYLPWRYAQWRGVNAPPNPFACEVVDGTPISSRTGGAEREPARDIAKRP